MNENMLIALTILGVSVVICVGLLVWLGKIKLEIDNRTVISILLILSFTALRFADKLAGDAYTVMTAAIAALYGVGSLVNGPIVSETVAKFLTKSDKVEVALENLRKENVKQLENTIKMMQK